MEFDAEIPALTRFFIALSELFLKRWPVMLAMAAGLAALIALLPRLARRHRRTLLLLDALYLNFPLWGACRNKMALARFSHALAMLLRAEAPILESLEIAGAACGSPAIEAEIEGATRRVAEGAQLSEAFEWTPYFPYTFCWLLANAEARGDAAEGLEYLAESF